MSLNAMADCVFPEDIMFCILTRLPVKSILRFKSVCKPWRHLFSTREFRKSHHAQVSSDPKNQSLIVHRINKNSSNTMSLFNIESNERKPTILDHPFSYTHLDVYVVGCCNGLVCVSIPPWGSITHLWNPALKLSKEVTPLKSCGLGEVVSQGFGYDAVGDDYKVVRILCSENRREGDSTNVKGVEVYSFNSDSWSKIEMEFQFSVSRNKSEVLVNGNPYFVATVGYGEVLVCFDVTNLVFKTVPLATLFKEEEEIALFDWNGCLGALLCTTEKERVEYVNVWVFDEGEQIWRKNQTIGAIEVNVCRFCHWSKNGKIVVERRDGKLFVFDPETGNSKALFYGAREHQTFEIHGYIESLACSEKMRQVRLRKRTRKLADDGTGRN